MDWSSVQKFLTDSLGYNIPIAILILLMLFIYFIVRIALKNSEKLLAEYNADKYVLIDATKEHYKDEIQYYKGELKLARKK
ncbi:hypothetical protein PT171_08790 [Erysipelothrix rhusiopathiae]|nr:hypothetical protein [Erysipelothrix rhusiopathiae]